MNKLTPLGKLARDMVAEKVSHGTSRAEAKSQGLISSIGSERTYREQLKGYLDWRKAMGLPIIGPYYSFESQEYLDQIAEVRGQKSIDQARQALQIVFATKLEHVASAISVRRRDKYIGRDVLQKILAPLSDRHALSTLICLDSGLRARELLALRWSHELRPTPTRNWSSKLFLGRDNFTRYCVHGKGGLIREIALSNSIAAELERHRLAIPIMHRDREVNIPTVFDIGGGQNFSNRFCRASFEATQQHFGAHCLRHTWARNRFAILLQHTDHKEAMEIVSQESGHFRLQITLTYLY